MASYIIAGTLSANRILNKNRKERTTMTNRKEKIDMYAKKLKNWDDKVQNIETKITEQRNEMKDELKSKAEEKIGDLRNKLKNAEQKLQDDKNDPDNFWEDLQKGIETNWEELKSTVKNVA
jgi:DNA repair exonuclease SbcCD ATPase subunit